MALRIIYGFDKTHDHLYALSNLATLKARRDELFEKFCTKLHGNKRFREEWLPERVFEGPNIRKQKIILEKHAKTNRLYNCPIYAIRRKLNDILVV